MAKSNDLTGQKFGMLTVLYRAENHNGDIYWHCQCDCGEEKDVYAYNLTSGKCKSCGCNRGKAVSARYPDLTGMIFGRLTVESQAENIGEQRAWNCICSCGNHCVRKTQSLLSKEVPSCGCYRRECVSKAQLNDLTGQQFGRLKVLHRAENRNGRVMWHCLCECGAETNVAAECLVSGMTKSCGCYFLQAQHDRIVDLVGQTFGKLYVHSYAGHDSAGRTQWECVCECGAHRIVDGCKLKAGRIVSCGCVRSNGEYEIHQVLNQHHIEYEVQKIFPDCKYIKPLPFDVYIPAKRCAIEYDGEFHYEIIPELHNNLEEQQTRDKIKTEYCASHGIDLIRIPYWEKDNIESILIERLDIQTDLSA